MDVSKIKGIKALEILNVYNGLNPYILSIKEEFSKNKTKVITETQKDYIVRNENYPIKQVDKVVEISQLLGETLQKDENLDFIPKKIMIDYLIGETEKNYHVIGRLTRKQKPRMYFLSKVLVIDDFTMDKKVVNVNFDRYNERLMEKKGFKLLPHQEETVKFLLERDGAILASDMGAGKALENNTLVYTPKGKTKISKLKIGDYVIGSNGKKTKVLGVYPQELKKLYKITFNDGFSSVCCGEHLWEIKIKGSKHIVDVDEMLNEKSTFFYKNNIIEIPLPKPIEFDEVTLNGNPYLFGSFLGRDSLTDVNSTLFIPEIYNTASVKSRIDLLSGIFDNNSEINNEKFIFKCKSERLVDDIIKILHSLGCLCFKLFNDDLYTLEILFNNDILPLTNKDKIELYKNINHQTPTRYIVDIDYIKEDYSTCIKVDALDHLFVIEHGIVTHNTLSTVVAALETRFKRILVVCPSSVKINWQREIGIFSDNSVIVEGRVYNQARFTIINPDILQNFHTLDSKIDKDDPPMYVSRELVNSKFDLIIIDEAHNLRNKSSIRGEIMSELCTKFGKPVVWLLSGTPVANRPKDFFNLLKLIRSPIADNFTHYMRRYCDGKQIKKRLANGKDKMVWIANGASNLDELASRTKHLVIRHLKSEINDMPDKLITNIYLKMSDSMEKDYKKVWDNYIEERERQNKKGQVQKEMVELGLLRKFVAMEAIPYTYEMAMNAVEDGKKVVVFTTFNDEQQELMEKFGNIAVCHNGGMSVTNKQHSVDSFQNNPKVKIFVGNIISAGTGITLTAGTVTIFNSFSWIPGDNDQGEDRTYRVGQKNDCNVYYMLFQNSVSEIVMNTLNSKRHMIEQIIDNNETRNISDQIMDYIIENNEEDNNI